MLIILDDFSVKYDLIFIPSKDENENGGEIKVAHLKVRSSTNIHAIHVFHVSNKLILYFETIPNDSV